ncbi:homoserine kinase [soil metagenome]
MLTPPVLRACAVRVPCSTSNLGAGFDCLGLAFDRYLDAGFEPGGGPSDSPPDIRRGGTLAGLDIAPADDVFILAFRAELRRRGAPPGGVLFITSEIPVGRGLGSSGAAVVAGIALAAAACGDTLDLDMALAAAVRLEGHPDNAAPALFGGLTAVTYTEHSTPRAMRLPLSRNISWVFAAPDATVSTARARAALPQQVPHSAAVRNTSRMAALLYGLANADRAAVAAGFNDELHVPYRLPLIPGSRDALDAATGAGAWAATISGSGSGLLAACPAGREPAVLDAMCRSFRQGGHGGDGFVVRPDAHGVQPRDILTLRTSMQDGGRR